jgi:subtilisin family serine protease
MIRTCPPADPAAAAWPGEYIVVIDPAAGEVTAAQAQLAQAGELVEQVTACGSTNVLQVWRLDDFAAAQQMLAGDPAVLSIEPNWIVRAAGLPTPPPTAPETPFPFADTYYASRQWNLQRSDVARAWQLIADHGLAQQTVRVAVIDSGVDFSHPDLAGRLLTGINYVTPGSPPNDDFGHGAHVTGIIAALANNGKGITGGASHVEIDPLKMLSSSGNGSIVNLNQAICDAADRGAGCHQHEPGGFGVAQHCPRRPDAGSGRLRLQQRQRDRGGRGQQQRRAGLLPGAPQPRHRCRRLDAGKYARAVQRRRHAARYRRRRWQLHRECAEHVAGQRARQMYRRRARPDH